jgi:hypothetical protein
MADPAGRSFWASDPLDMYSTRAAGAGGPLPPAPSPGAALYGALLDQLPLLVMALLKLLLAASVNTRGFCSPPVLDLYQASPQPPTPARSPPADPPRARRRPSPGAVAAGRFV